MTILTLTLYVGECPEVAHVHAHDGATAFNLIKDGYTVALPDDSWEEAEEVLRRLGLNDSEVADRVHFGLTGQVAQKPPDEQGASEGEEF